MVLVILAVIWAAVLVPPYLQSRTENRPADSISSFRNQLSVLERRATLSGPSPARASRPAPGPRRATLPPMSPARPSMRIPARLAPADARKRQREILITLLIAAGVTLLLGVVMPPVLLLHVLIDGLLGGYVYLLLQAKRAREERASKVRYLPSNRRPAPRHAAATSSYRPEPALALRRSGS